MFIWCLYNFFFFHIVGRMSICSFVFFHVFTFFIDSLKQMRMCRQHPSISPLVLLKTCYDDDGCLVNVLYSCNVELYFFCEVLIDQVANYFTAIWLYFSLMSLSGKNTFSLASCTVGWILYLPCLVQDIH